MHPPSCPTNKQHGCMRMAVFRHVSHEGTQPQAETCRLTVPCQMQPA